MAHKGSNGQHTGQATKGDSCLVEADYSTLTRFDASVRANRYAVRVDRSSQPLSPSLRPNIPPQHATLLPKCCLEFVLPFGHGEIAAPEVTCLEVALHRSRSDLVAERSTTGS